MILWKCKLLTSQSAGVENSILMGNLRETSGHLQPKLETRHTQLKASLKRTGRNGLVDDGVQTSMR